MVQRTIAVLPAYNEAEHIREVVKATKKYVDEVIVVDDGSSDDTYKQASNANHVLRHIVNMGKGMGMKTGFEAAIKKKADVVVFIDADSQHDPKDIKRLLDKLKTENLDLAVGVRQFNQKMPIVFRFGNWFLQTSFNFLFNNDVSDFSNGLRAVKTIHYKKIRWNSPGYAVEAEMLAKAGNHRLKIGEIPIKTIYLNNVKGTTIFDWVNIFLKMLYWKLFR